jgi:hypothetical protein
MSKPQLIIPAIIIAVILSGLYVSYGSVTPCGILKRKFKIDMMSKLQRELQNNPFAGLAYALGNPMIDSMASELSQLECARALSRYDSELFNPKPISGATLDDDPYKACRDPAIRAQTPIRCSRY